MKILRTIKSKKFIKFIVIFLILYFAIIWFSDFNFANKKFNFDKVKQFIPKDTVNFLKKKSSELIDYEFVLVKKEEHLVKNKKIQFEKFSNKFLKNRYYLTQNKTHIYAITNRGELFFSSKKNLLINKKIKLKKIKTNLEKIIGKKFIQEHNLVVKGILIVEEKIYVSYMHGSNKCYSNGVAEGNLYNKKIRFTPLFHLKECKDEMGLQVGGNIQNFKDNKIIITIGDYMSYQDPQNEKSYYGKILSIDLSTKNIEILSMGHRNSQGLFYDSKNDIIFSTDHGPQGGDEINVYIDSKKNIIKNYGWPISSYGEHYGFPDGESERIKNDISLQTPLYKVAPLNKSHKEYGFEEPIKYFTPSIGITQILKVNNSVNNYQKLLVASMGNYKDENDMTIHIINFDNNFKEKGYQTIYVGERIRDMIDLKNGNVLLTLESTGSFGLLQNIY